MDLNRCSDWIQPVHQTEKNNCHFLTYEKLRERKTIMKATLIPKRKGEIEKKIEHREIKDHFVSDNININTISSFNSTRKHYLEISN